MVLVEQFMETGNIVRTAAHPGRGGSNQDVGDHTRMRLQQRREPRRRPVRRMPLIRPQGNGVVDGDGQPHLLLVERKLPIRPVPGGLVESGHDRERQVVSPIPGVELQNLGISGCIASCGRSAKAFQNSANQALVAAEQVPQSLRAGAALNVDERSKIGLGQFLKQLRRRPTFAERRLP